MCSTISQKQRINISYINHNAKNSLFCILITSKRILFQSLWFVRQRRYFFFMLKNCLFHANICKIDPVSWKNERKNPLSDIIEHIRLVPNGKVPWNVHKNSNHIGYLLCIYHNYIESINKPILISIWFECVAFSGGFSVFSATLFPWQNLVQFEEHI